MTRAVALALAMIALAGCSSSPSADSADPETPVAHGAASSASGAPAACRTTYAASPLPRWARGGFSADVPSMPHVLGDDGDIVAILWAEREPLSSPPSQLRNNKILWVPRVGRGAGPLLITAKLDGTGETVPRTVAPAPGPSIVDLPSPGCWSLDLTWGRHHDRVRLGYAGG